MVALATMQEEQENFEDFRIFQVILTLIAGH